MERFYSPEPAIDGSLTLLGDEARHLARVRRVGPGDRVEVFDGKGSAVLAEVVGVHRDRVELRVVEASLPDREAPFHLTLATAVPKGERFDWLVEKASELGVERLVPIITARSVVDPRDAKLDRLRRLIVEACKQCGRNRLMELERPTKWSDLIRSCQDRPRWLADPEGSRPLAWECARRGGEATLAIGPEGGFTPAEVVEARHLGWQVIGLGATLLRIETAGLAGCSAVLALCEGSGE